MENEKEATFFHQNLNIKWLIYNPLIPNIIYTLEKCIKCYVEVYKGSITYAEKIGQVCKIRQIL